MLEFGSDFHAISIKPKVFSATYEQNNHYINGRIALLSLLKRNNWKRIWIPEYFCYEVIFWLKQFSKLEIKLYLDYPGIDEDKVINDLPFEPMDVLYRVNFFGLRHFRNNSRIQVPVIEDHTHDLIGEWSAKSNADWCIASLRKSLPIPEGGVLWSPVGHGLPECNVIDKENENVASLRWKAMQLKADYLNGITKEKNKFRSLYVETEERLDKMFTIANMDSRSMDFISKIDYINWFRSKKDNYYALRDLVDADVLSPESAICNPFSFIIMMKDKNQRDRFRERLIKADVYPAILWNVPDNASSEVRIFSERMISIHCDARYTLDDMKDLAKRINTAL